MQVTFIRHLPTGWNKEGLLQGQRDIPILPVPAEELININKNKEILEANDPFDAVLCSTLVRTLQTAMQYGRPPEVDNLLDEMDFGPFEGRPKSELIAKDEEKWMFQPRVGMLGEQIRDMEKRILHFIQKYGEHRRVLIFGHGAWLRAFMSIVKTGTADAMNQVALLNNECGTIEVDSCKVIYASNSMPTDKTSRI